MSTQRNNNDLKERFAHLALFLPTYPRPNYRSGATFIDKDLTEQEIRSIVTKWTKEAGQEYKIINSSIMHDDQELLKQSSQFICDLKATIKTLIKKNGSVATYNPMMYFFHVYRGLRLNDALVTQQYKPGTSFLWPTFSCASKKKEIAQNFGDWLFEIDVYVPLKNGIVYCADISKYSVFPGEEEVLFYPYTGFRVKSIHASDKVVKLECVDSEIVIQENSRQVVGIQSERKLYDKSRGCYVYIVPTKEKTLVHLDYANFPNPIHRRTLYENPIAYWDSPNVIQHKNGCFVSKGNGIWEEWLLNKSQANKFEEIPPETPKSQVTFNFKLPCEKKEEKKKEFNYELTIPPSVKIY